MKIILVMIHTEYHTLTRMLRVHMRMPYTTPNVKEIDMSIEYEVDVILKALDNIDDKFHIDWDEEDEDLNDDGEPRSIAIEVRRLTSEITEKCFDLINLLIRGQR